MHIAEVIKDALRRSLAGLNIEEQGGITLEHPAEFSNGDYSTNVALAYAKQVKKPPYSFAEEIIKKIGTIDGVAKIEVAGAGFINFHLAPATLTEAVNESRTKYRWGANTMFLGKKIMVEYTDPNPFKEFHIGHLMSNAIGESIARLIEYTGAEVKRANYQGDVGLHVAKAIWGVQKLGVNPSDAAGLGKAYKEGASSYEDNSDAKTQINAINKGIYDHTANREISEIYRIGLETSLKHFEDIYKVLGTKFDHSFFEGNTGLFGKKVVEEHPEVFEKSDGAVVYKGDESKGLHTRVFINSGGLPTYEAKELGLAKIKYEIYPYDKSIVITGNEVNEYFRVLLDAMSKIYPELATKTVHVSHGMMRLASGKMSSRTGDVITGESLLAELTEAAKARAAESRADNPGVLAQQVAVAAIKYQILKQSSGKDIIFDRERALSLEGDSGPYLQYAHARAAQVVAKADREGNVEVVSMEEEMEQTKLLRLVYRFPEKVQYAAEHLEPHLLTTYLTELAGEFNSWYAQVPILNSGAHTPQRVALADAVRHTLENGLWILGIPAPEKM